MVKLHSVNMTMRVRFPSLTLNKFSTWWNGRHARLKIECFGM